MTLQFKAVPVYEEAIREQVIGWRRYLHTHPELSFEEHRTAQYIEDTLRSFGSLVISRPTPTSVVARLIGDKQGKVLALRADIDALPIVEETGLPFASETPGVMHACGHDGHTAILLGAAGLLSRWKSRLEGEIRFVFQHAEELPPGGAQELVNTGVVDGVDWIIGAHLFSPLEVGKVAVAYGPMLASPDNFTITVQGKGGHAAMPHLAIDPIAIGAQIISNLQHIVSRTVDPFEQLVLSVTQFHAGSANNVIPASAKLGGTVRSFNEQLRNVVPDQMHQILRGITEAHGAEYELNYEFGYQPVINDSEPTRLVEEVAVELLGREAVVIQKPIMGGEDFSAYRQKAPSTFFNIGAGNEAQGIVYGHHHPHFTIDEAALEIGVRLFVGISGKLLKWS